MKEPFKTLGISVNGSLIYNFDQDTLEKCRKIGDLLKEYTDKIDSETLEKIFYHLFEEKNPQEKFESLSQKVKELTGEDYNVKAFETLMNIPEEKWNRLKPLFDKVVSIYGSSLGGNNSVEVFEIIKNLEDLLTIEELEGLLTDENVNKIEKCWKKELRENWPDKDFNEESFLKFMGIIKVLKKHFTLDRSLKEILHEGSRKYNYKYNLAWYLQGVIREFA